MKVLLAADGSDNCVRAADMAARLASPDKADVRILVVLSYSQYPYIERDDPEGRFKREKIASDAVDEASEKAKLTLEHAGHLVKVVRRFGYPSDEITSEIDEWEPDLVVMGRRGLRGPSAWLGSVSEHVLHRAKVPVLLVP